MTLPEVRLWMRLRARHPGRLVFRRQHPVGPYVIDSYCAAARLAVEIDGWGHAVGDRPERDERRDAWLRQRGIRTLRIPAVEVMQQCDETVERVVQAARAAIED
ncbi:MAG: DUF559 domain-containing protein [Hyphomicrobiales bacterium]|nr:DUF559 domain-containing protein [Hyphomicrobiales bacterium]